MLLLPPIKEPKSLTTSTSKDSISTALKSQYDGSQLLPSSSIDEAMFSTRLHKKPLHRLPLIPPYTDGVVQTRKYIKHTRSVRIPNPAVTAATLTKRYYFNSRLNKTDHHRLINLTLTNDSNANPKDILRNSNDSKTENKIKIDPAEELSTFQQSQQFDENYLVDILETIQMNSHNFDADDLANYPMRPRFFSKLSTEGQSALLATYTDTIREELNVIFPKLSESMPRIKTSKFRKTFNLVQQQQTDAEQTNNAAKKTVRIESFLKTPFSIQPDDPIFKEHQLTVTQQLEIAQQILDLLGKLKQHQINNNTKETVDILKAYCAYVKIWTEYFKLC